MSKYKCTLFEPKCPCGELEKDYHFAITYQRLDFSIKDDAERKKRFDEERRLIEEEYQEKRKALEELYCPGCGWEEHENKRRKGEEELKGTTLTPEQAVYCIENHKGRSCGQCQFKNMKCKHEEALKIAVSYLRMNTGEEEAKE